MIELNIQDYLRKLSINMLNTRKDIYESLLNDKYNYEKFPQMIEPWKFGLEKTVTEINSRFKEDLF